MRLHRGEVLFLIYATVFACSSTVSGAELTLHKMINRLVRTKRDTDESSSLYSQSPSDIASSIYQSLFEDILYGELIWLNTVASVYICWPKSL